MARRDLDQRGRVKYFTASTQPRISQDSETEFSSIESQVSSKQNIAIRKVKTSVLQRSPVDSSPWDTDEDDPSNKVKEEMRTSSTRSFLGIQTTVLQTPTKPSLPLKEKPMKETGRENVRNVKALDVQCKSSQTATQMPYKPCCEPASNQKQSQDSSKDKLEAKKISAEAVRSLEEFEEINIGITGENVGISSAKNEVLGLVRKSSSHKGNSQTHEQTREEGDAYISDLADRSEDAIRCCWRELFAVGRILMNIVTLFFIELLNFLVTIIGDRLLRPLLVNVLSCLLQPIMLNIFTGIGNLLNPLLDIIKALLMQVAALIRGFRLVEINVNRAPSMVMEV